MSVLIDRMLSAGRGQIRAMGNDPKTATADQLLAALDDLGRQGVEAGRWYWAASDSTVKQLVAAFVRWQQNG